MGAEIRVCESMSTAGQVSIRAWLAGGSEQSRKEAQRTLEAVASSGLVAVARGKLRTSAAALTDEGERLARRAVGLPCLGHSFSAMKEMANHCDREPRTLERLWVEETALNYGKGWNGAETTAEERRGLLLVEEFLLPALRRRLVIADSTMHGNAYYALTPAGWEILDGKPIRDEKKGGYEPEAREAYYETIKAAIKRMEADEPEMPGEIGYLGLNASMHGLKVANFPLSRSGQLQ